MRWNVLILSCGILFIIVVLYSQFIHICWNKEPVSIEEKTMYRSDKINFPYMKETAATDPMKYFDDRYIYSIKEIPKRNFVGDQQELLIGMVKKVANKLNIDPSEFSHGSFRLLKNGLEYNIFFQGDRRRVSVFQPFAHTLQMREIPVQLNEKVNIILPLKGKQQSLVTFLEHLVKNVLPVENRISLTIVFFSDDLANATRKLIKSKLDSVPFFEWSLVPTNDSKFSRGKGIRIGVEASAKNHFDLIFVCDVDVLFLPEFVKRCRANTIYKHQVYFPVVYSLYNPELVYSLNEKRVPEVFNQMVIDSENGFWRYFGFGMFCMHRNEYDTVGGVPEFTTWGREDLIFYEKFGDFQRIKVIRSLDTSIFHMFHHKNCSSVVSDSYPSCLQSKASSEGSQLLLGLLLMKIKEGIDVEGILTKRFYYTKWIPFLIFMCFTLSAIILYQCIWLRSTNTP